MLHAALLKHMSTVHIKSLFYGSYIHIKIGCKRNRMFQAYVVSNIIKYHGLFGQIDQGIPDNVFAYKANCKIAKVL